MRIISRDDREWITIHVDADDDLWYLKNIIDPGSLVRMTTLRRMEKQQDMNRSKETQRKPVTATITVETLEFQEFSGNLRVLGTVVQGPEDITGLHQSFSISPGDTFDLMKSQWTQEQKKLMDEAINNRFSDKFYFITVDDEAAQLILLKSYGIQSLGRIDSHRPGKDYESEYSDNVYFREIVDAARRMFPDDSTIIILGAGFTREKLVEAFRSYGGLKFRILSFPTTRSDSGAVWEFLNSTDSDSLFKDLRISSDSKLVESFLRHIKTDQLAAYGYGEVLKSVQNGSAETVLISEDKFRTNEGRDLIDIARNFGTSVHIMSVSTDPGRVVSSFGGYCAILRFRIS